VFKYLQSFISGALYRALRPNEGGNTQSLEHIPDPKSVDVMIKLYESARAEALQRMVLRDNALMFYIGAMGAYMSYLISHHFYGNSGCSSKLSVEDMRIAIAIIAPLPMISLIFTLVILHHHFFINRVGRFFEDEFRFPAPYDKFVHWDTSKALTTQRGIDYGFRLIAQAFILCSPMLYDTIFVLEYYDKIIASGTVFIYVTIFVLLTSLIIYFGIVMMHIHIHNKIKEKIVS